MIAEVSTQLSEVVGVIERQRRILQQQMDDVTTSMGTMIKDAMLNICNSSGIERDALKAAIAKKKAMLDAYGHTDETEK